MDVLRKGTYERISGPSERKPQPRKCRRECAFIFFKKKFLTHPAATASTQETHANNVVNHLEKPLAVPGAKVWGHS